MSSPIPKSLPAVAELDDAWNSLARQSNVLNQSSRASALLTSGCSNLAGAKTIGNFLKTISVGLSVILFICLALPQFTNDKQGLAIILVAAFIFWFGGKLMSGSKTVKGNFVDPLIILFFCINILSTCSSHYLAASFHGLLKLFVYVLAYFLLSSQLRDNPRRQFLFVGVLLVCGALLSLDGLYQYKIGVAPLATWEDPTIENQATRIYATFNNPNLFAGYLVPLIMLAASFIFACWQQNKWIVSLVPILLTGLLTVALVLTGSRGGYLGMTVGFTAMIILGVITLWQQNEKMRPFLLVLLVVMPVIAFAALHRLPGFEQRITSIFAGREHSSNSFRLNVWLSSLSMFKDNWLIGVGVGNQAFRLAYGLYMRSGFDALSRTRLVRLQAADDFLIFPRQLRRDDIVFGLMTFGVMIISLFYRAHLTFWTIGSNLASTSYIYRKWLTAGAAIAMLALLAHGLVDTVFFRPQVEFIFFLSVAIIIGNSSD